MLLSQDLPSPFVVVRFSRIFQPKKYKGQASSHDIELGWLKLVLKGTLIQCEQNISIGNILSRGAVPL